MPKGNDPVPDEQARHLIHGYYACVSFLDAQVGRLLDHLDKLKLREKTIVILIGDNGWKLGEHGSWSKCTNLELDVRVPLIISIPRQKSPGRRTNALVEFVDIYPTLCEVCGLQLPKLAHALEGSSFAPILENPQRPWKQAVFSQYPRGNIEIKDPDHWVMGYTMRTDRYRYTEWKRLSTGKVEARELYDHNRDPQENVNVAAEARYAKIVKELSEMMKRGWKGALPK
jgi:arylsulfatase A-like enzyme